jgi:hypothetical protein
MATGMDVSQIQDQDGHATQGTVAIRRNLAVTNPDRSGRDLAASLTCMTTI